MIQKVSCNLVLSVLASYLERIVAVLIWGVVDEELLISDEHVQDLQAVVPCSKVQDVPFVYVGLFAPCLPVLGDELGHELVAVDDGESKWK
jgi:hypothetical protein